LEDVLNESFKKSIKNIVWALRKIVSLIYHDSKKMVKVYGVTGPQTLVLKYVSSVEIPMSASKISKQINVTPANLTGIIDRLEEKGFVKRVKKEGDRRTQLIVITDSGKEFSNTLPDLIEEKLLKGLANYNTTEVFGIYSGLKQIIDVMDEETKIEVTTDLIE
jgi:DNA-binding MarR family transcriptional regulator